MFQNRTHKQELLDTHFHPKEELYQNLKEFEWINKIFGSKAALLRAFDEIYQQNKAIFHAKTVSIADLGCGGGDLLKVLVAWALKNHLTLNLIGLDNNPDIIEYAKNNANQSRNPIKFEISNILSDNFQGENYDIVCLNNVCHHFTDEELKQLLSQLLKNTKLAIIINDLHRHWIPYFAIKIMANLFCMSNLAKHDGPLSVLKGFQKKDILKIMGTLPNANIKIKWFWPFRWLVLIKPHCDGSSISINSA